MARIISWVIDSKFVYIEDKNKTPKPKCIYATKWSNEKIREHATTVLGWSEVEYRENFEYMYGKVVDEWGTAIDLKADYSFYFNATGEKGVYMLTGIDGANIADYGKPFYNLVIENNNTSLGLGGDYILDVDTTVKTRIYLERNGEFYHPDTVKVRLGTSTFTPRTYEEGDKTRVEIDIPENTSFANERVKEYVIIATKGTGYTGEVSFTVVGVRDGAEGVSYDLVLSTRQIKVNSEGEVSGYTVACQVLKNGDVVNDLAKENLLVTYDFGLPTIDFDDAISYSKYTRPITYEEISQPEHGDQVNFYLLFSGRTVTVIDTDSCTVSRDGATAKAVSLELDNEVDGVGVGDDTILQLDNPVTLWTGMQMYSAGTRVIIDRISVDDNGTGISISVNERIYPNRDRHDEFSVTGLSGYDVGFYVVLKDGFDFGEDFRDSIEITAYGHNPVTLESCSASATYVIIGIEGGEDGSVYKLSPSTDYILYDPNSNMVQWGAYTKNVSDITSNDIIELSVTLSGEEYELIDNVDFIRWTTGVTYSNASTAYAANRVLNKAFPLTNLSIDEMTAENAVSKFVTFYWLRRITPSSYVLLDRETVPVIMQGINGNSAWIELGNEIDGVSVGDDTDLDITNDVEIGTTVRIMSGGTPIEIAEINGEPNIQVIPPAGTETNWAGYTETGCTWAEEDTGHTIAYVSVTLKNGFEFGPDYREVPTIKATSVDGWTGFTKYVIMGIAGGIDGYVYRIVPSVDYVSFDPNMGSNGSLDVSAVTCDAYYGKYKLGDPDSGFTNGKIYYSINKLYDKVPANNTDTSTPAPYVTNFTEYDPSGINLSEKINQQTYQHYRYIALYLVVDGDIVDRETVKIVYSGKNGTNGVNGVRFDSTNPIEVINTGTDTILNVSSPESYKTVVHGYEGVNAVPITLYSWPQDSETRTIATATTSDNLGVEVTVTLYNGFNFGPDQKEKIDLVFRFRDNPSIEGTVSFTLVCLLNGEGAEGSSYKLRSNVSRIIADGASFSPQKVTSGVYVGDTLVACTLGYAYKPSSEPGLSLADMMDWSSYPTKVNCGNLNPNQQTVSAITGGNRFGENGTLYVAAFSGGNHTFIDADDIPIQLDVEGGSSSALIGDLTNDNGVIATGDNERLDNDTTVILTTIATVRNGFDKLKLTNCTLPSNYTDPNGHGTITFAKNYSSADSAFTITITLSATGNNYIDFSNDNPRQFQFVVSAQTGTSSSEVVQVTLGYSILALKYGKDGDRLDLLLNTDQIFYDTNKPVGERFSPSRIYPEMYVNGEKINDNIRREGGQIVGDIMYQIKNSDMEDPDASELWLDSLDIDASGRPYFEVTELQTSEYEPLTIRAMSGNTLLDWETVQIYRNGQDGEGGLEVKISPERLGITVENSHPKVDYTGRTLVHLQSGSTIDPISSITAESDYADFGTASTKNVRYSVSNVSLPGLTDYKWVNITATTNATITTPIEVRLAVTSDTDGQTRYAVLILEPTTGGQGAQGDRGPKTRIRAWSSGYTAGSGENYVYFAGDNGEPYWDIVYYEDIESGFVGYFGCKTSHTPSQGNLNEPSVVSGEGQTTQYWEYYPDYDFLATKVITIGEGLEGWVIDKGKIQHTLSGITLDADGSMLVQKPAEAVIQFRNNTTGEQIYVVKWTFSGKTNGTVVTAYSAYTENGETKYKLTDDSYYKTSSTGVSREYEIPEFNLWLYGFGDSFSPYCDIDPAVTGDKTMVLIVDFTRYDNDNQPSAWYSEYTINVTGATGNNPGNVVITNVGEFVGSATPNRSSSGLRLGGGDLNGDPGGQVSGGEGQQQQGGQQQQIDTWEDYQQNLDPLDPGDVGGYIIDQDIPADPLLPDGDATLIPDNAEYKERIVINKITMFDSSVSPAPSQAKYYVAYNNFVLVFNEGVCYGVDFDYGSDEPIYDYNAVSSVTLTKGSESTITFDSDVQVKIQSVDAEDYETPVISIGDKTQMLADGTIICSNGYFSGTIRATDGSFEGTAKIKTGEIENVKITGSTFYGNIVINGENSITMVDGNRQVVEISNKTLTADKIANSKETDEYRIYHTDKYWDESYWTRNNGGDGYSFYPLNIVAIEGDRITIPSCKISAKFANTTKDVAITVWTWLRTSDGRLHALDPQTQATGWMSYPRGTNPYSTNGILTGKTVATAFTINSSTLYDGSYLTPGQYSVYVQVSVRIQKKLFGNYASCELTFGSNTTMATVKHVIPVNASATGFNKFTIARNGFGFSGEHGGRLLMVSDMTMNGKQSDIIYIREGGNGNGLYLDEDEFYMFVDGNSYNMKRVMEVISKIDPSVIV